MKKLILTSNVIALLCASTRYWSRVENHWNRLRAALEFSSLRRGNRRKVHRHSETSKQWISFLHLQTHICNSAFGSCRCRLSIYLCRCWLPRTNIGDAGVYQNSTLYQALENNTVHLPQPEPLTLSSNHPFPHVLVADEAFPLKTYIMKPYAHRGLNAAERIFNYR